MSCPICQKSDNTELLSLNKYPIYQHPMVDSLSIPLPHTVDLDYVICNNCGHGHQKNFDRKILESIYKNHYYTPSPDNVGAVFRSEFIEFFSANIDPRKNYSLFEIGCSSGDVLAALKTKYPLYKFKAVEPNIETANVAKEKGFDVYNEFFSLDFTKTLVTPVDIIYSRHVIEHIFNFNEFFSSSTSISHQESLLILETPSLDWSAQYGSVMPFHVEHIHVFSERSLITLANIYGWYKNRSTVTPSGNLIISFTRQESHDDLPIVPQNISRIQKGNTKLKINTQDICKNKKVIFWGAGSGAITLLSLLKLSQVKQLDIVDGNPNKSGKSFCGQNQVIRYAPDVISELIKADEDKDMLMVISSSFHKEIHEELNKLGWRGEVYAPYQADFN
jgi:hypothetical protein